MVMSGLVLYGNVASGELWFGQRWCAIRFGNVGCDRVG